MKRFTTVNEFMNRHQEWSRELKKLRKLLLKLPFKETIKWGVPAYTIDGKNVVGIGAFKNYVGLWFFNGSFLKDKENKLYNAQDGKTRGMRQWRFNSLNEMDEVLITQYLNEAITNQKEGKVIKLIRNTKPVVIPSELKNILDNDAKLNASFEKFSISKQREYATYISEAKREATKQTRLQKITPMIFEGKGLYDKYKNC